MRQTALLTLAFVLSVLSGPAHANASASQVEQEAALHAASELTQCAAFFSVYSRSLQTSDPARALQYQELAIRSVNFALAAASNAQDGATAKKERFSEFNAYESAMHPSLNQNQSMAALSEKHLEVCTAHALNPAPLIEGWVTKINQKYATQEQSSPKAK